MFSDINSFLFGNLHHSRIILNLLICHISKTKNISKPRILFESLHSVHVSGSLLNCPQLVCTQPKNVKRVKPTNLDLIM